MGDRRDGSSDRRLLLWKPPCFEARQLLVSRGRTGCWLGDRALGIEADVRRGSNEGSGLGRNEEAAQAQGGTSMSAAGWGVKRLIGGRGFRAANERDRRCADQCRPRRAVLRYRRAGSHWLATHRVLLAEHDPPNPIACSSSRFRQCAPVSAYRLSGSRVDVYSPDIAASQPYRTASVTRRAACT